MSKSQKIELIETKKYKSNVKDFRILILNIFSVVRRNCTEDIDSRFTRKCFNEP